MKVGLGGLVRASVKGGSCCQSRLTLSTATKHRRSVTYPTPEAVYTYHLYLHNIVQTYTSGVTNTLVGVSYGREGEQVLVRVYGHNTHLFIDRVQEINTLKVVHKAGCGPEVFAAFTNGLCYAYTPGVPLTFRDVTKEPVWRGVTRQAARFHKIQAGDKQKAILFPKLRQLLALLPDTFTDPKMQHRVEAEGCTREQLVRMTEELEDHLVPLSCPVVFCHNDLRAWLKSYLAHYHGLPEDQVTSQEVEMWLGWVTKFTLASHLFWVMYGIVRLAEYKKKKQEVFEVVVQPYCPPSPPATINNNIPTNM
ncbi:Ethanolamine kinase 1-like 2 [Homarus americanus]|uniref:ethanolamine kinase n=1 Tax=Homarus americanus TaxID=6706 RepID=A0A8J5KAL6_HOMAM|nr:Ethanolamine kinase 1-like 2 [Homarus americanus]